MVHRRDRSRRLCASLPAVLLAGLAAATPVRSGVYLNELHLQDPEAVELYNRDAMSVDLSGWRIAGTGGEFVIPAGTVIGPHEYIVFINVGGIFADIGGETSVIDITAMPIDRVSYGKSGSAPLPTPDGALVRAPDAADAPPPAPDPYTDGTVWTATTASTLGSRNLAPQPALGSSVRLNELLVDSSPTTDAVELYNPAAMGRRVSLAGWSLLIGGVALLPLPAAEIGPGQTFAFTLPAGVEIETTGLVYLFDAAGVRLDQLGISALRTWATGCPGRLPDGQGPATGWDLSSSELVRLPCSLGDLNCVDGDCATPRVRQSWGAIKFLYR